MTCGALTCANTETVSLGNTPTRRPVSVRYALHSAERRCNGLTPATLGRTDTKGASDTGRWLVGSDPDPASSCSSERIVVLDGAWGTMLQGAELTPADYRGDRIAATTRRTSPATRTC